MHVAIHETNAASPSRIRISACSAAPCRQRQFDANSGGSARLVEHPFADASHSSSRLSNRSMCRVMPCISASLRIVSTKRTIRSSSGVIPTFVRYRDTADVRPSCKRPSSSVHKWRWQPWCSYRMPPVRQALSGTEELGDNGKACTACLPAYRFGKVCEVAAHQTNSTPILIAPLKPFSLVRLSKPQRCPASPAAPDGGTSSDTVSREMQIGRARRRRATSPAHRSRPCVDWNPMDAPAGRSVRARQ